MPQAIAETDRQAALRLAPDVGVHVRTMQRYITAGCPVESADAVQEWRKKNIQTVDGYQPSELKERQWRADLAKTLEQARQLRLKNEQRESELISAAEVAADTELAIAAIETRLATLGDECAADAPTEMQDVIRQAISERVKQGIKELRDQRR